MSRTSLMLISLCFATSAIGQTAQTAQMAQPLPREPRILAEPATVDVMPQASLDYPGGIKAYQGVPYHQPSGFNRLTMDIYAAKHKKQNQRQPLIVFIHGGGWMAGHSRQSGAFADFPDVLASIAQTGYVVASINYRLSGEAASPAAVQDAKLAVRWLRAHADDYGIDPEHVAVWGASAGGQIAGLLAASCGVKALQPDVAPPRDAVDGEGRALKSVVPQEVAAQSDCVQSAVLWYSPSNFASLLKGVSPSKVPPPIAAYLGCTAAAGCNADTIALASPITHVGRSTPPMLLIHGDADTSVPTQQSVEMAKALKAAGVDHELIILPGIEHSLIGKTPQATREASQKALAATLPFFARTLKAK